MFLLYRVLTTLLYPFLFIFVYYRKIIKKEDPVRYKEKVLTSYFNPINKEKFKLIWFHAASIGEFKSIMPIIHQLNSYNKNLKFLITTTTLSSGNLAKIELRKIRNIHHRYLPLDVNFLINKFIFLWKPDYIFLVDSEIWPNLILKAKEYKIPIALINARLTPKSFRKWMFFPNTAKKLFEVFDLFICSNLKTKANLEKLNLKNVFFKGNIKLADHIDCEKIKNLNENIFAKKKFWFAASIHKGEDLFCFKTHIKLREKFKDIVTIIAPRHIERSREMKSLAEKFNLKVQILNQNEAILENKEIIIINYFGALKSYFKFTKSVLMGKSILLKFKNEGGQNPLEAAKLECKIYHGPYINNFEDIYKILENNNISKKIENYEELSENLISDLKNYQKSNTNNKNIIDNLGQKTLKETMTLINNFLSNEI